MARRSVCTDAGKRAGGRQRAAWAVRLDAFAPKTRAGGLGEKKEGVSTRRGRRVVSNAVALCVHLLAGPPLKDPG